MEFWFTGRLDYRDQAAIDAARKALAEEGCAGHPDNLMTEERLHWAGTVLTIEYRGSMPYSCFEICSCVLRIYAEHATAGDVIVLDVEDGFGYRFVAGGSSDEVELDDQEIHSLRRAYGWDVET
jgi:hypothetical protein